MHFQYIRSLKNEDTMQPFEQANDFQLNLLSEIYWQTEDKIEASESRVC